MSFRRAINERPSTRRPQSAGVHITSGSFHKQNHGAGPKLRSSAAGAASSHKRSQVSPYIQPGGEASGGHAAGRTATSIPRMEGRKCRTIICRDRLGRQTQKKCKKKLFPDSH